MKKRCAIGLLVLSGLTPWTHVHAQQPGGTPGSPPAVTPITPPGLALPAPVTPPATTVAPVTPPATTIAPVTPPATATAPVTPPATPVAPKAPETPSAPTVTNTPSSPSTVVPPSVTSPAVPPLETVPSAPGTATASSDPVTPATPGLSSGGAGLPGGMGGPGCAAPGCAAPVSCDPPRQPIPIPQGPMGCVPFYFGADYLYWYMKRDSLPPLITEGNPQQATVLASTPGALGVPGTVQIAPNLNGTTAHSGVRFNAGAWFDKEEVLGIQGSYFFLFDSGPKTSVISTGGPDSPLIARPFFDTTTVAQSAVTVFSPAGQGGGLTINNPSRMMGGDVNIVYNFAASTLTGNRCGLLVGARYLGLDETLNIDQVNIPYGSPSVGTWTNENFTTHNHFYGGQIGLSSENLIGPVYIQAIGKVAVGQNSQQVVLSGYGSPLLIPSSYIGSYNHNVTSCVPEGQFNVGYRFNDNFMFKAGYNVIALTNAVRPSGAMNTNISETPITTSPTSFHNTTFWTQGVSLGLQWNF